MIIHADMDAFYASVEIRERPELSDKPVVVGGSAQGRGVVSAANYVARRFGIRSAMPMAQAIKRCAELVVLPVRMELYAQVSTQIQAIFHRYTPLIETLSLDEAFLDVTASEKLFGPAANIALCIKKEVREELGLVVSVGIAPNKFIAKIASDLHKPDGFLQVQAHEIQEFLDPLPVERIWGVGKVTAQQLHARGISTIKALRLRKPQEIQRWLGQHGLHLWELAHGRDTRKVEPFQEAVSISNETTFARDVSDRELLKARLLALTEKVAGRLRQQSLLATTVQLKIRFHDFKTITRAQTLDQSSDITQIFWQCALTLFEQRLPQPLPPVRLIGFGVSGLREPTGDQVEQSDLFAVPLGDHQRDVDKVADAIRSRFGSGALHRASVFKRDSNEDQGNL